MKIMLPVAVAATLGTLSPATVMADAQIDELKDEIEASSPPGATDEGGPGPAGDDAADQGRVLPCGRCEKCRRIVGMMSALGADPQACGYTAEQIDAFHRQLPHLASVGLSQLANQRSVVASGARIDLSAVAPGATPANPFRFQHHHPPSSLRQLESGRQAGEACTDDANVRSRVSL